MKKAESFFILHQDNKTQKSQTLHEKSASMAARIENYNGDELLEENSCVAKFQLVPNKSDIGPLFWLASPSVEECSATPLAFVIGGVLIRLHQEVKEFAKYPQSCRLRMSYAGIFLTMLLIILPAVLALVASGASAMTIKLVSIPLSLALVIPATYAMREVEFRSTLYKENAQAFFERLQAVTEELSAELSPYGLKLSLNADVKQPYSSEMKYVLKVFNPTMASIEMPALPQEEGQRTMYDTVMPLSRVTGLFTLQGLAIDRWTLGGLAIKLQAAQKGVAKCSDCTLRFVVKPLAAAILLCMFCILPFAMDRPILLLAQFSLPILLIPLFLIQQCLKEYFDMKNIHAANALVVEEFSCQVTEPRNGHRLIYEVRRDDCLPYLFTRGFVRFEAA